MSLFLPNPCLLGILVAVSTHSGPLLVYHYPPKPKAHNYKATPVSQQLSQELLQNEYFDDFSSSSSGDEGRNDESDASSTTCSMTTDSVGFRNLPEGNYVSGKALLELIEEKERRRSRKAAKRSALQAKLAKTTSHDAESIHKEAEQEVDDKKVFGFDVDFLSELVHPPHLICNNRFDLSVDDMTFVGLPIHVNDDGTWRRTGNASRRSKSKKSSSKVSGVYSAHSDNPAEPEASEDETLEMPTLTKPEPRDDCPMHMFHIVFVMNPPIVEYNQRIDEMFHYVISRLSLILRYEQAKSNYVWNELLAISKVKEESGDMDPHELSDRIIAHSSLARAVSSCYNSISNSNIANLEINGKLRSFQIPIKTEFSTLLPSTVPVLPGSYLSSINPFTADTETESTADGYDDMVHLALLLLDDPETIISDIQAEKESVLANFIRTIRATESLNRLAAASGMDIQQIQSFASHLIYWRRARMIPPIQARNVYIVSPMAPISSLKHDMSLFKQQFQALPSLSRFLSLLSSSKPRQYSSFIPSHDHRDMYLGAIAWLIRHGYVTQLHTYVWVKISSQIKMEVDEELENEAMKNHTRQPQKTNPKASTDNSSKVVSTDNSSKKEEQPIKVARADSNTTARLIIEDEGDTILLDPERASAIERRWVAKCLEGKLPEIVTLFYRLLKYFNGKHPLEILLVREGLSRQELRRLLAATEEYIISVKHW
ncbi:hypothetical protein BABINDRAFT_159463 [Babjeviella inositovora NRRL Y-12698]|uniref:Nitrogen permease regulator 3 n=1 Tax=Babjeviella inositovora NRRL Y-12698 TaxID=984486 RepID=A0A1E3QZ79_9ASCO|nr:uncharacterized protein BABINDRAFT_159463 [Babjeviella inositovora NRRL Y-12698]ODQ82983.1 hypothetical protein BABINDRAFT_159463 [Babjeviella inositovora NRRL Y-12698]